MINGLRLKQAEIILDGTVIKIQLNQKTVEYSNHYTAFDFEISTRELIAPNFKLVVNNSSDSEAIARWFESLYL